MILDGVLVFSLVVMVLTLFTVFYIAKDKNDDDD